MTFKVFDLFNTAAVISCTAYWSNYVNKSMFQSTQVICLTPVLQEL